MTESGPSASGLFGPALDVLAAGGTVVTANRRLALAVAGAFNTEAGEAADAGRSWRSPDVLPWEAWVRREWMRHRDSGRLARRQIVLSPAQSDRLWQRVLETAGENPVDLPAAEVRPAESDGADAGDDGGSAADNGKAKADALRKRLDAIKRTVDRGDLDALGRPLRGRPERHDAGP